MKPKISIILAAFNEEKLLPRCLKSLQNQSFPKEMFEIIVVDNGSTDNTAKIAEEFGVKVFTYKDIYGCGASRDFGAGKAEGDIIAFTDPDCIIPFDWVNKIDKLLSDSKTVFVGGKALPCKKNVWTWLIFHFYDLFHIINHSMGKQIVWGFNMAVKKTAYEKVGGINRDLLSSDDWEIAFKLCKQFGKESIKYARDLEVYTSTRKLDNIFVFLKYAKNGLQNYIYLVILGKVKAKPTFNVR